MVHFRRHEYKPAQALLNQALAEDESCGAAYFQLGYLTFTLGDPAAAFPLLKKAKALGFRNHLIAPLLSQELPTLRPREFGALLEKVLDYDLRSICRGVAERGAIPVLLSYPYADLSRDRVRRRTAEESGGAFVPHQAAFDIPSRRYFCGDNPRLMFSHLNSAGYRVFAEGVLSALRGSERTRGLFEGGR